MSRKPLYDIDEILTQSVAVFLEHGFYGTAMDEIIARAGFNRRGFYIEFGSKQHFLYRVLEHYLQTQLSPIIADLEQSQGLASIQTFFDSYIEHVQGRGCLLINCITELGFDDAKVRDLGRHYLDRLQIAFIGCLEKASENNQISPRTNIESIGLQLTSYVQGFAVNSILAEGREELRLATAALLDPLR